jgi:alpha-beta hydrolase superfamily lysophospholipase
MVNILIPATAAAVAFLCIACVWLSVRPNIENKVLFPGAGTRVYFCPEDLMYHYDMGYYSMTALAPKRGVVMFLHGNGADAPSFYSFALKLAEEGWDVIMPEYDGYGELVERPASITETRKRIVRVWRHVASSYKAQARVLLGFSLGGGFAYSVVDELVDKEDDRGESTQPTNLVLVNTFSGVREMPAGAIIASLASSEVSGWNIADLHKKWRGSVLVVWSPRDEIFSASHAEKFRSHFADSVNLGSTRFKEHRLAIGAGDMRRVAHYHSQSPLLDTTWIQKID